MDLHVLSDLASNIQRDLGGLSCDFQIRLCNGVYQYTHYLQCGLRPIAGKETILLGNFDQPSVTLHLFFSIIFFIAVLQPFLVCNVQRLTPSVWVVIPLRDTPVSVFVLRQCPHHRVRAGWRENEIVGVRSQSSTCSSTPSCRRRLDATSDESDDPHCIPTIALLHHNHTSKCCCAFVIENRWEVLLMLHSSTEQYHIMKI